MDRLKRWARLLQPRRLLGRWTGPRVLVVSVPKAGTNLLRHVLCMFPQLSGAENVVPLSVEEQLQRVAALRPGRIISSHLAWQPELGILLTEQELRGVYISRDPRDVCVSYCHYVMQETRHPWHSYFRKLPDDGTRLMIAITGVDEHPSGERRWFLCSDAGYPLAPILDSVLSRSKS
jgi:hypothetical protein